MCFGSGSSAGNTLKQQQEQRAASITAGQQGIDSAFAGFNPGFFAGVRDNTIKSLLPQEEDQYRQNRRALAYKFGQQGILTGSAARFAGTDLEKAHALGQFTVGNQANEAARTMQKEVEGQKQQLTNQLVVSQDPNLAAQQAVSAAATISAPSLIQPLGNLFQGFGNAYLANQIGQQFPGGTSLAGLYQSAGQNNPQSRNFITK